MSILTRQADETEKEFCNRLYRSKETLDLTWQDITNIINKEFGYSYGSDKYRKDAYRYFESLDTEVINNSTNTIEDSGLSELKLERMKLADERSQINAIYRRISREDTLKEIARDVVASINESIKLDPPLPIKKAKDNDRVAILQLSDIHYGIEDKTMWNEYSPKIAKQRIQKLQDKVAEYLQKENINTLYIVNLGDMIGGRIHLQLRLNSRIDVVTQTIEITEILANFMNNLSAYATIYGYFSTDNHSRLEPSLSDSIDLEALSRITPWYLQDRLANNKNIILYTDEKYGDDIIMFTVLGHKIAACHGHKDTPGKILKNLSLYTKQHFDMILSSHFHHTAIEEENDTMVVYNGSILSTDSFAEKLRLNSKPSQNLIIVSRENVMEVLYKINLD